TSFWRVDHGTLPCLWRQPAETTDHRGATSADRDEMNPTLVDAGEFRMGLIPKRGDGVFIAG
ncbi:MAG: hypothetical protein ACXVBO_19790, partial [Isosphaeraceae bacterium]